MMLESSASSMIVMEIDGNETMNNNDTTQQGPQESSRSLDEYEYYYHRFSWKQQLANDTELILPTQRGFTVDPTATYKIWYGENLRRVDFENNIGEVCVNLTIEYHQHPLSWLENEEQELLEDETTEQLDYNSLFT